MPPGERLHWFRLGSVELVDSGFQAPLDVRGVFPQQISQIVARDWDERSAGTAVAGDKYQLVFCGDPSKQPISLCLEFDGVDSSHGRF